MKTNSQTKKLSSEIESIIAGWEADFKTVIDHGIADEETLETFTYIQTIRNLGFLNVASAMYLLKLAEAHLNDKSNLPELKSEAKNVQKFIRKNFNVTGGNTGNSIRIYRVA